MKQPCHLILAAALAGAVGTLFDAASAVVAAAGAAVLAALAFSALWPWVAPVNSEGLPLWTCQLFHSSKSEKEKIIQRMVRRISIAPVDIGSSEAKAR